MGKKFKALEDETQLVEHELDLTNEDKKELIFERNELKVRLEWAEEDKVRSQAPSLKNKSELISVC